LHPEPALLRADRVGFWRGGECLFVDLDFELRFGQLALVTGPNGSGKTTLLRAAAGLTPPTQGAIRWDGVEVHRLAAEQRGAIAYRGHQDGLKKDLSVTENLDVHRSIWRQSESPAALLEALRLAGAAQRAVRHLSAGQRRRVGLAALRLSGARLWILDEPTTSLDAQGLELFHRWVRDHVRNGGMALVATHQPEQLMAPGTLLIEL
jgi:heme exporter protein A